MVMRNSIMSKNNAPREEKRINEYFGQLLQIKKNYTPFITIQVLQSCKKKSNVYTC
jgi:hypothetical protein